MDMLNSDLQLKNEAMAKRIKKSTGQTQEDNESEAGFHFIAFVPAMGKVWKFDGLERQPQVLGKALMTRVLSFFNGSPGLHSGDNWLDVAKPDIRARMTEYEEDQIEFSVLGLVHDPILNHIKDLALNIRCLRAVTERLGDVSPSADHSASPLKDAIFGPAPSLGLTQDDLDNADVPLDLADRCQKCTLQELVALQQSLVGSQRKVADLVLEELQSHQADDDHAAGRRHDYGPAVRTWIRLLTRKGVIQHLLNDLP
jgi:ubiquitin carboxyl-terminal hydrolase L5